MYSFVNKLPVSLVKPGWLLILPQCVCVCVCEVSRCFLKPTNSICELESWPLLGLLSVLFFLPLLSQAVTRKVNINIAMSHNCEPRTVINMLPRWEHRSIFIQGFTPVNISKDAIKHLRAVGRFCLQCRIWWRFLPWGQLCLLPY